MRSLIPAKRSTRLWLAAAACAAVVAGVLAVRPIRVWRQIRDARAALRQHEFDAALHSLHEAERIDPNSAEVQFLLARAQRRAGQPNAVRPHLDRARELGFLEKRLQREWWLTLAQTGRLAEAEPHLPELLQDPGEDGAEICEAYFHGYRANLRFDEANALLDVWSADMPGDPEPYFLRGLCAEMLSDYSRAAKEYGAGLEMAPQRNDYRQRLASALLRLNQPEQAAAEFRRCLVLAPDDVELLVGLGACLQELGQEEEAASCFRQAAERDPQNFEARIGLGKLALAKGDAHQSLRWLEPLAAQRPGNAEAQYSLSQALNLAGQTEAAKKHLAAYQEAFRQLERLETLFAEIGRDPDNVEKRFEIGRLLLAHHSRENGAAWLNSVLQLDPRHRGAHLALANYYESCGRQKQAAVHRQLAGEADNPEAK